MNNPSLENNYVIVCKYYSFEHVSCDIWWCKHFFIDFRKNSSCGIPFNPIWCHIARFSKNDRKCSEYIRTGPDWFMCWLDYFWVSYDNQMKKNCFWIAIKKIWGCQQKMNGNDAIAFWYFERNIQ